MGISRGKFWRRPLVGQASPKRVNIAHGGGSCGQESSTRVIGSVLAVSLGDGKEQLASAAPGFDCFPGAKVGGRGEPSRRWDQVGGAPRTRVSVARSRLLSDNVWSLSWGQEGESLAGEAGPAFGRGLG